MKNVARTEIELTTRNAYTKVDAVVTIEINGREVPTMAVLGTALDEVVNLVQQHVTKSYQAVPARV